MDTMGTTDKTTGTAGTTGSTGKVFYFRSHFFKGPLGQQAQQEALEQQEVPGLQALQVITV